MNITELPENIRRAYAEIDEILAQPTPRKIPRRMAFMLRPPILAGGVINLVLGVIIPIIMLLCGAPPKIAAIMAAISLPLGAILTAIGVISIARKVNVLSNGIRGKGRIAKISALPYHANSEGFFKVTIITGMGDKVSTIVSSRAVDAFSNISNSKENSLDVVYIPGKKLCVLPLALAQRMQYKNLMY